MSELQIESLKPDRKRIRYFVPCPVHGFSPVSEVCYSCPCYGKWISQTKIRCYYGEKKRSIILMENKNSYFS